MLALVQRSCVIIGMFMPVLPDPTNAEELIVPHYLYYLYQYQWFLINAPLGS